MTLVIGHLTSLKAAAPATVGTPSTEDGLDRLLDELEYPARKWQVVTTAEPAGADNVTLDHLNGLPRTIYGSLAHIRYVLALGATPRPPRPPVGPNSPEVDAPHRARRTRGRP